MDSIPYVRELEAERDASEKDTNMNKSPSSSKRSTIDTQAPLLGASDRSVIKGTLVHTENNHRQTTTEAASKVSTCSKLLPCLWAFVRTVTLMDVDETIWDITSFKQPP
eukprot:GHVN01082449.1.p3 GENE.GHVN01082449.1~~GHVN01082449.1.p3  ORF type:complete len:109 (-),score=13.62 GHVN01082449.1:1938-2264(-)